MLRSHGESRRLSMNRQVGSRSPVRPVRSRAVHTMKYFHRADRVAFGVRPGERDERVLRTLVHTSGFGACRGESSSARSTVGNGTLSRNVASRTSPPNRGRRMRTYPVVERNESITSGTTWTGATPSSTRPIVRQLRRRQQRGRLLPAAAAVRETLEMHPQYVLENGVDFAHFKFVHNTPIVPVSPARLRRTGVVRGLHHHLRRRRSPAIDDVKTVPRPSTATRFR